MKEDAKSPARASHPARAPVPLRRGDRVAVVAPASPFPPGDLQAGVDWLRERYRVEIGPHVHASHGYLAGTDAERGADLAHALADPGVRAIFCARGGYGVLRLLEALRLADLQSSPKWICGFSDVTALHAAASDVDVASLHAPNLTGLGRAAAADRQEVLDLLEAARPTLAWSGLSCVHGAPASVVRGRLFGGNVALLHALAAAGRLRVPEGAIVMLEDVGERPYRLDRMLVSLRLSGHLARAAAVVLGDFRDCGPGADGITAAHVLEAELAPLNVPVWQGAPFGHGAVNRPLPLGLEATVGDGTLHV